MSRGVPKDLSIKAQEQLTRQEKVVDRLTARADALERELRELRIELTNERGILDYYRTHPALKVSDPLHTDELPLPWEGIQRDSTGRLG